MAWRLFLDEHIALRVAKLLAEEGHIVVPAVHRKKHGQEDWDLLRYCFDENYIIVTKNASDFLQQHYFWQRRGDVHPGILLVPDWLPDKIYRALSAYLATNHFDDMINVTTWIPDPDLIPTAVLTSMPDK